MKALTLISLSFTALLVSCVNFEETKESKDTAIQIPKIQTPENFDAYWQSNGAEISSYKLEQARYGEVHSGTAVLVYVTEPFSSSKQVKLDNYKNAGDDRVNVLKLNMTKKFITGIYPYSMMLSTFSPLDGSPMIKSTTSSQEWCGHTWLQLNRQDSGYRYSGFSYFESEGDQNGELPNGLSEDQLWTQIRVDPNNLPTGELELLPATFFLRLKHEPLKSRNCTATLSENEGVMTYDLNYDDRSLSIRFEKNLPYRILGWEETYPSGFGNPESLTTTATLINSIRSRYWGKNSNADRKLREQLGLSME